MFTYGSFYSGIDAPLYAVRDRVRALFACEIDKYCCATMRANYDIERLHEGDVTKLDLESLPTVDIFTAGFPCQPYSAAGHQRGQDDPRAGGWVVCCDYIQRRKPRFVLLENVPQFRNDQDGETLRKLKLCIQAAGYAHVSDHLLNSIDYGSCQSRKRLFIVAVRDESDAAGFRMPTPGGARQSFHELLDKEWLPEHKEITAKRHDYIERRKRSNRVAEFHDIDTTDKARTLCSAHSHNSYNHMIRTRDGRVREVSGRECLRLMGFGDDFKIVVSRGQTIKQAGNSMVVQTVRAVLGAMLSHVQEKTVPGVVRELIDRHFAHCTLCVVPECGNDRTLLHAVPSPRLGTSRDKVGLTTDDAILHIDWTKIERETHLCGLQPRRVCVVVDCRKLDLQVALGSLRRIAAQCVVISHRNVSTECVLEEVPVGVVHICALSIN